MERRSRRQLLRDGLALTGAGLLAGCMPPRSMAERAKKVPRIGYLGLAPIQFDDGFAQGLRDLGYVEGESIAIERRWAEGRPEHLPDVVDELLGLGLDLLVTRTTAASRAAKRATSVLPIVFSTVSDPVGAGLVTNLGRPEANVTGVSNSVQGINGKRLQLLKEAVPAVRRIALLADFQNQSLIPSTGRSAVQEARDAARDLGVDLLEHDAVGPDDFDGPFQTMKAEQVEALFVFPSATVYLNARAHIVGLANEARLPTMCEAREWAQAGGLLAYGVDLFDVNRRAATYVDRLLKGAKPADLPVEQPTKFEFAINLKTARDLGLSLPQSVLLQATEVIP